MRPVAALMLVGMLTGCSWAAPATERLPEPDTAALSGIRESAARDILRRSVEIDRPMDVMLAIRLMARPAMQDPATPTLPELPEFQLFTGRSISMSRALSAVSRSMGYPPPGYDADVDPQTPVRLSHDLVSLEALIADIERQARVTIALFPRSRTILVLPQENAGQ